MNDLMCMVLSVLVLTIAAAVRPDRARCPTGWWVPEGIRTSGEFTCRPPLHGDDVRGANGIVVDHSTQPHGFVTLRVYCSPNSMPTLIGPGAGLCSP